MREHDKTLRLLFPQWQGGDDPSYLFGARLLAWLAPEAAGPIEEVAVALPDGADLPLQDGIPARQALLAQVRDARARIDRYRPDRIVVLGGDCGVDLAPFAYLNKRYDGELAVLWVDAHSDLYAKEVFPNAHAHVLGTLLGEGDDEFLAEVKRPIAPGRAMIAGWRGMPGKLSALRAVDEAVAERRQVRTVPPRIWQRPASPCSPGFGTRARSRSRSTSTSTSSTPRCSARSPSRGPAPRSRRRTTCRRAGGRGRRSCGCSRTWRGRPTWWAWGSPSTCPGTRWPCATRSRGCR